MDVATLLTLLAMAAQLAGGVSEARVGLAAAFTGANPARLVVPALGLLAGCSAPDSGSSFDFAAEVRRLQQLTAENASLIRIGTPQRTSHVVSAEWELESPADWPDFARSVAARLAPPFAGDLRPDGATRFDLSRPVGTDRLYLSFELVAPGKPCRIRVRLEGVAG